MPEINREKCKHGMIAVFCSTCNPPVKTKSIRKPVVHEEKTVFGQAAPETLELKNLGYVVVSTNDGRNHHSFKWLGPSTKFVHIDGHPFLWAIEAILSRATGLRTLQVVPSIAHALHPTHKALCVGKGVKIVEGYHRPDLAWEGETRSPFYSSQRKFLIELKGEQKDLFEELLTLNFEEAHITSRYFCLKGETFLNQRQIAIEYGLPEEPTRVSERVNAVIYYLDRSFQVGEGSQRRGRVMKARVERLRQLLKTASSKEEQIRTITERLGIPKLPEGLPLSRLDAFEVLLNATRDPKVVSAMQVWNRTIWRATLLRFGLAEGSYLTLQQVAERKSVSHEAIRLWEERVLTRLGVVDE